MDNTVSFRDFEERDIDFIYRCKNDEKLNSMIVGEFHPFSYEDAIKWVHGCMGEHDTYKFWAICTNDGERRIIGWLSLSTIDPKNKSACFYGIVIGDPQYRDGRAWIESFLFLYHNVFVERGFNRLYGSCLTDNKASLYIAEAMLEKIEGVARQAVYKNGKFHDVLYAAILKDDYLSYLSTNEFEMGKILNRLMESRKTLKKRYNL